jgi:hypothetical protein
MSVSRVTDADLDILDMTKQQHFSRSTCEKCRFYFILFYIRCIILRTILRMQPLGYGAIVQMTNLNGNKSVGEYKNVQLIIRMDFF